MICYKHYVEFLYLNKVSWTGKFCSIFGLFLLYFSCTIKCLYYVNILFDLIGRRSSSGLKKKKIFFSLAFVQSLALKLRFFSEFKDVYEPEFIILVMTIDIGLWIIDNPWSGLSIQSFEIKRIYMSRIDCFRAH